MGRPLGVRWRDLELPEFRAGALAWATVELENAGETSWVEGRFRLSYHWLDDLGNAIVWDGLRAPLEAAPGQVTRVELPIRAPIPPGRYRLAVDVVDENRLWFGEVGEPTPEFDVDVLVRDGTPRAHLGDAIPASDWHERVARAHRDGFGVVGGAVEARKPPPALAPYTPPGPVPNFAHPLVCPSVLDDAVVSWTEVAGLPAAVPHPDEPSLYDGRIRVRLPSGRRRG
jgi:hypothetical protein